MSYICLLKLRDISHRHRSFFFFVKINHDTSVDDYLAVCVSSCMVYGLWSILPVTVHVQHSQKSCMPI